jgi:predicted 3-demethylubiquinone-9 3-methyltransferase (glyoxalase superfamily)
MQRITPNVWFNGTAAEATAFYASVLPGGRVTHTDYYPTEGLPDFQKHLAGKELVVEFEVAGYRFMGINAGPEFPVNPAISFMLNFDPSVDDAARAHLDEIWTALAEGGRVLMPLDSYDFSPRYGWVQDRYGVTWQLMLTNPEGEPRPFVIPCLTFGDVAQNRAGEAVAYYTSVFPGTRAGTLATYSEAVGTADAGSVMFADLEVLGQWFAFMDAASPQDFTFTPGVSLMVECADQAEIDRYWDALSAVPEAEQCGWCTDRFGVSWQIVPSGMSEYLGKPGAYEKMLSMKKIDLAAFG